MWWSWFERCLKIFVHFAWEYFNFRSKCTWEWFFSDVFSWKNCPHTWQVCDVLGYFCWFSKLEIVRNIESHCRHLQNSFECCEWWFLSLFVSLKTDLEMLQIKEWIAASFLFSLAYVKCPSERSRVAFAFSAGVVFSSSSSEPDSTSVLILVGALSCVFSVRTPMSWTSWILCFTFIAASTLSLINVAVSAMCLPNPVTIRLDNDNEIDNFVKMLHQHTSEWASSEIWWMMTTRQWQLDNEAWSSLSANCRFKLNVESPVLSFVNTKLQSAISKIRFTKWSSCCNFKSKCFSFVVTKPYWNLRKKFEKKLQNVVHTWNTS